MNQKRKTPDILVEQAVLGELPPRTAADVRRRLAAEPDGQARLAAVDADNRAMLEQYPPQAMAAAICRRAEAAADSPRRRNWFPMPAVASLAAMLALAVLGFALWPIWRQPVTGNPDNAGLTERIKGDSRLFVHLKAGADIRQLRDGDSVQAGDLLQISYLAGHAAFGTIVSVDGGGNVTLHYPAQPGDSTQLLDGGVHALPFAYELDRAPRFERFFFITGDTEIDVPLAMNAAGLAGDPKKGLVLPREWSVIELTLIKPIRNP